MRTLRQRYRHGPASRRRGILSAVALLVLGAGSAEALPELSWLRSMVPVQGRLNRSESARLALGLRTDPALGMVPIAWRVRMGDETAAQGDTLVPAAHNARETAFTLRIPALEAGNYALELLVDPTNRIQEKDETNNGIAFVLEVPNGSAVKVRCEGPEGSVWDMYRLELSTASGTPYPDEYGTPADTTRSTQYEIVINGVEPGPYMGVIFGPSVNRMHVLLSHGAFEMPEPSTALEVVWPRTTPYMVGRPRIHGDVPVTTGGQEGAPRWKAERQLSMEGAVRNPTDRSADVQWLLRFSDSEGTNTTERDTLVTLGALVTENLLLTGRVPRDPGNYLIQAEVRVPWPTGFEDLGDEERVASHILPIGWIEVER